MREAAGRTLIDGPTRFGIFIAPFHGMEISPTVLFERDLELIERADQLGLQEAWVGEHTQAVTSRSARRSCSSPQRAPVSDPPRGHAIRQEQRPGLVARTSRK